MSRRFSWTSERVSRALGVPRDAEIDRVFQGVSTDSRTLRAGELFVALRGEQFDGAEFVHAALKAGAAGAVAERRPEGLPADFPVFVVNDALRALGQLATLRRRELAPTVVAITGTVGKTTTRALMTAALGPTGYGSPGNFNNLVGAPLSVLRAPEEAGTWVLELASNQPGEIERLGRIVEPNLAVITSVSEGHLEGLGDLDGVMREKLSLLSTLREGGRAWVPAEPGGLAVRARRMVTDLRTVGLSDGEVRPEAWSVSEGGVSWRWQGVEYGLPYVGTHMVLNAMFALAVAHELGVDSAEAAKRLGDAELPPMRGQVRQVGRLTLLIDCYNANPSSFRVALEALEALAAGRRRRGVLAGTMLELGAESPGLHERVARWMLDSGIELIAVTGEFVAAFERLSSASSEELILAPDLEAAYRRLSARMQGDEVVLVKASRGLRFERAIPLFESDFGGRRDVND